MSLLGWTSEGFISETVPAFVIFLVELLKHKRFYLPIAVKGSHSSKAHISQCLHSTPLLCKQVSLSYISTLLLHAFFPEIKFKIENSSSYDTGQRKVEIQLHYKLELDWTQELEQPLAVTVKSKRLI